MDVKSAFLNGPINELVYVKQPLEFDDPYFPDCRCQNRRISGRGSGTVRLRSMVTGDEGHNVYPGSGPLYGGNTLRPA